MADREMIKVNVWEQSNYGDPFTDTDKPSRNDEEKLTLAEAQAWLKKLVDDNVPAEFRADARFFWEDMTYHGHQERRLSLMYRRPETDQELRAREESEQKHDAVREKWEREMYESLRNKFGTAKP
jgi:hypothetical protein